jgi:hypothetical protein
MFRKPPPEVFKVRMRPDPGGIDDATVCSAPVGWTGRKVIDTIEL